MVAVAIDGPAGAGKSTLARRLAKHKGFIYVDTGALYRAIGLKLLRKNISCKDEAEVEKMLSSTELDIRFADGEQVVMLDNENVNRLIRTPEVSMMASKCSAFGVVRAFLLDMQRNLAKRNSVVMDGRDIGTVVLPNAKVKIFLTASALARAKRRYNELLEKGTNVDLDSVLKDIEQRDYNDSHREIAPLKQAEDAVLVDTTELDLEQSFELLLKTVDALSEE
ncbi:MAG: (d)CMP kinase [Acutalibacteraceae bacterium]|nr:(d)CMP kinase [Acutalibacteraceae bacterium]